MGVLHYDRQINSEVTYVHDVSIGDLIQVATQYLSDEGATWRIEENTIIFERPMGESLAGRNAS